MAKISQVSVKYIVHASITIDGVVDRPDVIGAIFGQTEGLMGADLELRDLQRSGKIGRIEVNLDVKGGKAAGDIIVPSSLDKAETAIIAAALEIIERIGPCNAKIKVKKIEDIRISKRQFVINRAKELLQTLTKDVLPDSQELADEVAHSVRVHEIGEYGKDRLPAGPSITDSEEVIVVEGRADVLNLLKYGFKNVIAMNGTSVPETIIELAKEKTLVAFVDGDRGGDLNIQALLQVAEIDFVTKAPDGKEVEELTQKEIHKCLRGRITAEQAKLDFGNTKPQARPAPSRDDRGDRRDGRDGRDNQRGDRPPRGDRNDARDGPRGDRPPRGDAPPRRGKARLNEQEKSTFKQMLEDIVGTRGAYILDEKLNILGKVPLPELVPTIKSLGGGVNTIIVDAPADSELVSTAERAGVQNIVAMDAKAQSGRISIITPDLLE